MLPTISHMFTMGKPAKTGATSSGGQWANARVAANKNKQDEQGNWEPVATLWLTVKAFDNNAVVLGSAAQGQRVYLSGELQEERFTGDDGVERTAVVLVARQVALIEQRQSGEWQNTGQQNTGMQGGWQGQQRGAPGAAFDGFGGFPEDGAPPF